MYTNIQREAFSGTKDIEASSGTKDIEHQEGPGDNIYLSTDTQGHGGEQDKGIKACEALEGNIATKGIAADEALEDPKLKGHINRSGERQDFETLKF